MLKHIQDHKQPWLWYIKLTGQLLLSSTSTRAVAVITSKILKPKSTPAETGHKQ